MVNSFIIFYVQLWNTDTCCPNPKMCCIFCFISVTNWNNSIQIIKICLFYLLQDSLQFELLGFFEQLNFYLIFILQKMCLRCSLIVDLEISFHDKSIHYKNKSKQNKITKLIKSFKRFKLDLSTYYTKYLVLLALTLYY